MNEKAKIYVSKNGDYFKVKVTGRATFAVAPTMRNIVQRLKTDNEIKHFSVELTECTGMDSTFMGILTQLALTCTKLYSEKVKVINPGEANIKLLHGLGLDRLFEYVETDDNTQTEWHQEEEKNTNMRENAETVLNAHKTLIEAVPANKEKFAGVVAQVEKELK
jgi:anti-anti-sigma regulatory factor